MEKQETNQACIWKRTEGTQKEKGDSRITAITIACIIKRNQRNAEFAKINQTNAYTIRID